MQAHIWTILESLDKKSRTARCYGLFMSALILLNAAAAVAGTNGRLELRYGQILLWFEYVSVFVFCVEYLLRAWSCTADTRYCGRFGRIRYLVSALAVIDLLAIAPFFLSFAAFDLRTLRLVRLVRIGRLVRLRGYRTALDAIRTVILAQRQELILCVVLFLMLTLISGSAIYYCENPVQPEKFPDVPSSLSWAIGTLTASASADAQPVTPAGRACGWIISILGILMFALPTGIVSAGFMDYAKNSRTAEERHCPHCGKPIVHEGD
jgi:voltage-gated potassium channel